jgi:hypothetical protein
MSAGEPNLYELLEVEESAGDREIALAFRRVAKRWHPDLNSTREATERMQHISAAYEVLRDPDRRAAYNLTLRHEPHACTTTERESDPRQHPSKSTSEPWWMFAASSPLVTAIADPRPPAGYATLPPRSSPGAAFRGRTRQPSTTNTASSFPSGDRRIAAASVLCLIVCPFLAFMLAAWCGRDRVLARWGAVYALAPAMWGIGAATGSPPVILIGLLLALAGTLHGDYWRWRLWAAIASGGRNPRR